VQNRGPRNIMEGTAKLSKGEPPTSPRTDTKV
jgi:hypothetical protein